MKNSCRTMQGNRWLSGATAVLSLVAVGFTILPSAADARLIFTTEGDGNLVEQDLDGDGNFSLFFGDDLSGEIEFDKTGQQFIINDDVNIQQDLDVDLTLNVDGTSTFGDDVTFNNDAQAINLRVENQATAGAPACTDASDLGRLYYDTDTNQLFYCYFDGSSYGYVSTAGAASDASETFYAEFANFSVLADGTNNVGTLEAEYDDTANRSFYQWSTRQASAQDYDLVLQWQVPANFNGFDGSATDHLQFDIQTAGAGAQVDVVAEDNTNATITTSTANTAVSWGTVDVDLSSGTVAAGDTLTFKFKLVGDSVSVSQLGNVKVNYSVK